jgi:polyisoprenoid-binding protein YceI
MTEFNDLTPGTWTIDPQHSAVAFVVRHLMITKVRGRFTDFSGTITVPEDRLQASVQVSVDLASVDTGDAQRDAHLRTSDFFETDKHPHMTFRSTGVKVDGPDITLIGDLTIKDVTRPIELDVEFDGISPDPWGGTRAGFSAEGEISRKEWGLEWNVALETGGFVVADKVKIEIDVQAVQANESG